MFDMFVAILCGIGFLYLRYSLKNEQKFKVKEMIYYFKTIYGLCAFPFLIFAIPGVNMILMKSKPTGYDK
jgi:hypothetical protein